LMFNFASDCHANDQYTFANITLLSTLLFADLLKFMGFHQIMV
jgi:hypothetical protein